MKEIYFTEYNLLFYDPNKNFDVAFIFFITLINLRQKKFMYYHIMKKNVLEKVSLSVYLFSNIRYFHLQIIIL